MGIVGMKVGRSFRAMVGAALVVAIAAAAPASAAQRQDPARRDRADARLPVAARMLGGFTPSVGDALGATARAGTGADLKTFRFTPSGQAGAAKGVTLGLRARPLAVPDIRRGADGSDGYDVGVALAARGMALTGSSTQIDTGLGRREAVSMGVGYGRRDWTAQLRVGEEREDVRGAARLGAERRYSVEAGGAVALGQLLSVGAGVRYRVAPEGRAVAARPDDRSAYLGLGVKF